MFNKWHINCVVEVHLVRYFVLVVGGLISAHLFSQQAGMEVEPNWPCDGPLLRLAVDLATRLLPGVQMLYVKLLMFYLFHLTIDLCVKH